MRDLAPYIKGNPPVKKSVLGAVEFHLQASLPTDYATFLLAYNGGKLYYNSFERIMAGGDTQSNGVDFFYDVSEDTRFLTGEEYRELTENKILPIATTLVPGLVGIGLGEVEHGAVYVLDWDFGLTRQATSFTEFLEQIQFDEPTAYWQREDPAFQ